ncbi:phosphate signaling complex protein PhoU [Haloarchaeobius sp. HME9146]|uniref:phosphate signaling complex protein PhoU n=1 Tax=Haloarchaeobius sp. HME9146 TaxID=2978732 RepID=UPI0021BFB35A|nr:phosphate signaling complex protein PhoU [Haloarchaeobius sp. HME9146]MCT9097467.1 phosphate signaling complex protein PhoU [Haloarchaeobius sp. HME9146]
MPRESFQQKLDSLETDVVYMSDIVVDRLRTALSAMEAGDESVAWQVVNGDGEVNQLYLDIEQQCIDVLALQQPVASDLRFVAASFKILTDLERIGDLATNLAQYTINAERDAYPEVDVQAIGTETIKMVEWAMEAYAERDVEACYDLAAYDDEVDAKCEHASQVVVRDLLESEAGDETDVDAALDAVSRLLLTVRDLERVGDHAVNIAARTLYMVENDDELIY